MKKSVTNASSAISFLFTFSMLMLIMSNNFVQLFFGWEAVGLVSYLLIGFYFKRPSAIFANLKAFLINRVGDFGFLLGIGLVLAYFGGSLRYQDVFAYLPNVQNATIQLFPGVEWSLITVTCLLLFVGAWVNRLSSRCTSGCLIRWKARHRFLH